MYIDAEGTFRPQRLLQIADRCLLLQLPYNNHLALFSIMLMVLNAAGLD